MDAADRWRELVSARLAEMERLRPGRGDPGPTHWDRLAASHTGPVPVASGTHPLVRRILAEAGDATTVADAGAGTGRITLAVAPHVRHVHAVDRSRGVLDLLLEAAAGRGIDNVTAVHAAWEDADVTADVAVCSYVIPKLPDATRFLRRLDAAASRRVFVEMGALSGGWLLEPLWRRFHGSPRRPHPTYLDALDLLAELGIRAELEVVELPVGARFRDLDEAVDHHLDALLLDDGRATREELAELLRGWLVRRDGLLAPPARTRPSAIITWAPTS